MFTSGIRDQASGIRWANVMTEQADDCYIRNFMDLRVWQEAMTLVELCYQLSSGFPKDEMYGLTAQLRRAAISVPANIAEGYGRENKGSYVQFLRIAQGSLREVQTHLFLAQRLKLADPTATKSALEQTETVGKMLNGLIRSLQNAGATSINHSPDAGCRLPDADRDTQ